jgi:phage-related protein
MGNEGSESVADVIWLGDSLNVLLGFPKAVQYDLGYALRQVQLGQLPPDSKPMRTVGQGVYELREQDEMKWYRAIYLKKIDNEVYVLHCFEKQSAQTEQHDINTAKARLKRLQEQQRKERRDVKRGKESGVSSDTRKRS